MKQRYVEQFVNTLQYEEQRKQQAAEARKQEQAEALKQKQEQPEEAPQVEEAPIENSNGDAELAELKDMLGRSGVMGFTQ